VHDGFSVWCAARRLNAGRFVWPRGVLQVSVSLQAVTFALSCCHRLIEQISRFSGLGGIAHAHIVIQGHRGGTGRFAPFTWHNLAFDPFTLSLSA